MSNKTSYKRLKEKQLSGRKRRYDFDQGLNSVVGKLIPRKQASKQEGQDNSAALKSMQADYDKKIDANRKAMEKSLAKGEKSRSALIENLGKQVQAGDERNLEISQSLQDALKRIAQSKQTNKTGGSATPEEGTSAETQSATTPTTPFSAPPAGSRLYQQYNTKEEDKEEKPKEETTKVEDAVKKSLSIDQKVSIGKYSYKVTNLFGIRSGANSVPGREGRHSRGVDLVGFNEAGKSTNLPIAITDGTITAITLHGSGKAIHPTEGTEGGYIMDVTMPDGKVMKYMHLGKDVFKNKSNLLGKKIKRGDLLYEGDYSKGSGSQTAPHIKVMVTSVVNGKQAKDYTSPDNDPTNYIIGSQ